MPLTFTYRCPGCGLEFATQEELDKHARESPHTKGQRSAPGFHEAAQGEKTSWERLEEEKRQAHQQALSDKGDR
jgi:hypothetical protein